MTTSKIVVALVVWGAGLSGFAQTNTFPSAGNVGIGTTNPSFSRLQIGTPSGSDTFSSGFDVAGKSQVEVSNNGITEVLRLSNYSGASAGIGPRLTFASNNNELTAAITGVFDGGTNGQLRFDTETSGVLTEKLRVTSAGNIGIGTTSPGAKLELMGPANNLFQYITANAYSGEFGLIVRDNPSSNAAKFTYNSTTGENQIGGQQSYVFETLYSGGAEQMRITTAGNVGIGTSWPTNKLEVAKDFTYNNYTTGTLRLSAASNPSRYIVSGYDNTLNAGVIQSTEQGVGQTSLLLNPNGGNVGIGTTNPTQKLSVNGTIQAKEVVVQAGWSDFVFDAGYKLKTLSETEVYIQAEHHLPGIPSAHEVAEHGVSMGEMQSKLLAKIEELTLHLIEQEKRLAKIEAENSALRATRP